MVSKVGEKQSLASGQARREAIVRVLPELESFLGRSPSLRDIGQAVNLRSVYAVKLHVDQLIADGRLVWEEPPSGNYRHRKLRLVR